MLYEFVDVSGPPMSESQREGYQRVIKEALAMMRPRNEAWSVTASLEASVLRLDFKRETDAPRSFSILADGDDDQHSQMFRLVCLFLKAYWPNDDERPS